jgi:multidrug efflux pump subunit AcrA (membrane-fusion protein)
MNLSAEEQKKLADDKLKLQNELRKLQLVELDRKKADDEQKAREEEQDRLKQAEEDAKKLQEEQDRLKQADAERKLQVEQEQKRLEDLKVKPGDLVAIAEVTVRPVKISGGPPLLSSLLQTKYSGRTMLIMLQLLIDETGAVSQVRVLGATSEDVKSLIVSTLLRWKYSPAQKDNVNVKVYMPLQFNMVF